MRIYVLYTGLKHHLSPTSWHRLGLVATDLGKRYERENTRTRWVYTDGSFVPSVHTSEMVKPSKPTPSNTQNKHDKHYRQQSSPAFLCRVKAIA